MPDRPRHSAPTASPATETRTVRGRAANDAARGRLHLTRDEVHRLMRGALRHNRHERRRY